MFPCAFQRLRGVEMGFRHTDLVRQLICLLQGLFGYAAREHLALPRKNSIKKSCSVA